MTDRRSGSAPSVPVCSQRPGPGAARGWRSVQVAGSAVQVPGGTALDLTAFALPTAQDDLAPGHHPAHRHGRARAVVFGLGLGLTSASLVALHAVSSTPPRLLQLGVLVAANALATVLRFVLLRAWVFNRP
ncbi:MAG TPA: hypothetical protein VKB14_09470 [Actinomycetales bacterium]|nr:hypothetical protein [Actinomycetales bacterium]